MSAKKTKKWIPPLVVILFAAGAGAALILLPEDIQGTRRGNVPVPLAAPSAAAPAPAEGAVDDLNPPDVSSAAGVFTDEDDDLPLRFPTIDEEEKEYPTPFARPDDNDDKHH